MRQRQNATSRSVKTSGQSQIGSWLGQGRSGSQPSALALEAGDDAADLHSALDVMLQLWPQLAPVLPLDNMAA